MTLPLFPSLPVPPPPSPEAKRPKVAPAGAGEGDDEEREDELPTVVMLEEGDVGEEEYKRFREAMKEMSRYIAPVF